jgi:hypothetical protein
MLLGVLALFLAVGVFPEEAYDDSWIQPNLKALVLSHIPADTQIRSIFPNTEEMAEKIMGLITNPDAYDCFSQEGWIYSLEPISASDFSIQKALTRSELATSIRDYIRREIEIVLGGDGAKSEFLAKIVDTQIVNEVVEGSQVVGPLTFTTSKASDGTNGYGLIFRITCPKSPVKEAISDTLASAPSKIPAKKDKNGDLRPSNDVVDKNGKSSSNGGGILEEVSRRLAGDETLQRMREENRAMYAE